MLIISVSNRSDHAFEAIPIKCPEWNPSQRDFFHQAVPTPKKPVANIIAPTKAMTLTNPCPPYNLLSPSSFDHTKPPQSQVQQSPQSHDSKPIQETPALVETDHYLMFRPPLPSTPRKIHQPKVSGIDGKIESRSRARYKGSE